MKKETFEFRMIDRHIGNEYDTDISLEYEDSDKYDAFLLVFDFLYSFIILLRIQFLYVNVY